MEYLCLACGHRWDRDMSATYLRCPDPSCRSRDVVPDSFWSMVETARERGISPNTPIMDILDTFKIVFEKEGLLTLGFTEFWRTIRRVIREVEHPSRRRRIAVEG